jgi:hypothetical protein
VSGLFCFQYQPTRVRLLYYFRFQNIPEIRLYNFQREDFRKHLPKSTTQANLSSPTARSSQTNWSMSTDHLIDDSSFDTPLNFFGSRFQRI